MVYSQEVVWELWNISLFVQILGQSKEVLKSLWRFTSESCTHATIHKPLCAMRNFFECKVTFGRLPSRSHSSSPCMARSEMPCLNFLKNKQLNESINEIMRIEKNVFLFTDLTWQIMPKNNQFLLSILYFYIGKRKLWQIIFIKSHRAKSTKRDIWSTIARKSWTSKLP